MERNGTAFLENCAPRNNCQNNVCFLPDENIFACKENVEYTSRSLRIACERSAFDASVSRPVSARRKMTPEPETRASSRLEKLGPGSTKNGTVSRAETARCPSTVVRQPDNGITSNFPPEDLVRLKEKTHGMLKPPTKI